MTSFYDLFVFLDHLWRHFYLFLVVMFGFVFFLCIYLSLGSYENGICERYNLESIITESKDYANIKSVLYLLKKRPNIYTSIPQMKPLKEPEKITSFFGVRNDPFTKERQFHKGVDFKCSYGNIVYATAKGRVVFSGYKKGYGNCIIIQHNYGFKTLYAHLSFMIVKENDIVSIGESIGFVGISGKSTGEHLHYEIIKNGKNINPVTSFNL